MKWKDNKVAESKGVNFVTQVICDSKSIFNKIDTANDVGIDGYIEFVEREFVTGICAGVQIKSGNSNLGKNGDVYLKSDKDHFLYWKSHLLPIIGIVYIPKEGKGFWIDITEYLEKNKNIIESGSYNIKLDRENEFCIDKFSNFYEHLNSYKNRYKTFEILGKSLIQLISDEKDDRIEAVKTLYYYQRNRKETWTYLIRHLSREKDKEVIYLIVEVFSYITGNFGDANIGGKSLMEYSTKKKIEDVIKKYNVEDIIILLNQIDEESISRQSIGQVIHSIIDLIDNKVEKLRYIIFNENVCDHSREHAVMLVVYYLQSYKNEEEIFYFLENVMDQFPYLENLQELHYILSLGEYFSFY